MLRKLTIIAAALALVLAASVPALAQLDTGEDPPEPAFDPDRYTVGCSDLYPGIMPTICAVDENALYRCLTALRLPTPSPAAS